MQSTEFTEIAHFLAEPSFLQYCDGKDAEATKLWQDWLITHPEKQALATQARQVYWTLVLQEGEIGSYYSRFRKTNRQQHYGAWVWRVAAILIAIGGIAFFFRNTETQGVKTVKTGNDEIIKVLLPDSSEMFVNGATEVHFDTLAFRESRTIYLIKGEIFCQVNNGASKGVPFIVETPSGLKVEDISTSFSVKSNSDILTEETVQVQEGLVHLHVDKDVIQVRENELVRFDHITRAISKGRADQMSASGWIKGEYAFYDATMAELAKTLENLYKINIRFKESATSKLRISIFFIKSQEIGQILENIEDVYNLNITKNGSEVIFE